jgi:hypothetical protein
MAATMGGRRDLVIVKMGVLSVALLVGAATGAEQVRFYDTDGSDGEDGFTADLKANGYNNPTGDFVTFCAETLEGISYGTEYDYVVSTDVKNNGGFGPRALTSEVGYLYSVFAASGATGVRALGDGSAGAGDFDTWTDKDIRELVQRAIWDQFAYPDNDDWVAEIYTQGRIDFLWAQAIANNDGSLHGVRVMNVYAAGHVGDESYGYQDMLIVVPLPTGAGLASVGLLGLAVIRRRRG